MLRAEMLIAQREPGSKTVEKLFTFVYELTPGRPPTLRRRLGIVPDAGDEPEPAAKLAKIPKAAAKATTVAKEAPAPMAVIGRRRDTALHSEVFGERALNLLEGSWSLGANDAWVKNIIDSGQPVAVASLVSPFNLRGTVFRGELEQSWLRDTNGRGGLSCPRG